MSEEKIKHILDAMQGITYLDWLKLKHAIDAHFNADVNTVANKVLLADADRILESYKHEF